SKIIYFFQAEDGIRDRNVTGVQTCALPILNTATPTKVFHVLTTAYLTVAAILAAITAFMILKKKATEYHKKALKLTVSLVFIFGVLSAIAGDVSAKFLAEHQPEKLAAAEWHFETE